MASKGRVNADDADVMTTRQGARLGQKLRTRLAEVGVRQTARGLHFGIAAATTGRKKLFDRHAPIQHLVVTGVSNAESALPQNSFDGVSARQQRARWQSIGRRGCIAGARLQRRAARATARRLSGIGGLAERTNHGAKVICPLYFIALCRETRETGIAMNP